MKTSVNEFFIYWVLVVRIGKDTSDETRSKRDTHHDDDHLLGAIRRNLIH